MKINKLLISIGLVLLSLVSNAQSGEDIRVKKFNALSYQNLLSKEQGYGQSKLKNANIKINTNLSDSTIRVSIEEQKGSTTYHYKFYTSVKDTADQALVFLALSNTDHVMFRFYDYSVSVYYDWNKQYQLSLKKCNYYNDYTSNLFKTSKD
jgi:hypothetical protein